MKTPWGVLMGLAALLIPLLAPATASAGALERIRDKGEIVLGYVEGAAPFSFTDGKKEPQGYSVDLCREIASGIRNQLALPALQTRWVALTIQDRLEAVRSGRVDIDCSTTTWTLTRQRDVDFSLITFIDGATVLARGDTDIFRLSDFGAKRIAVIRGTTTSNVLDRALKSRSIAAEVVPVGDRGEGLGLLRAGKVDGFASDRLTLIGLVLQDSGKDTFRLLDDDFSMEQYALALPRNDHDFRLAVNSVLARLYRTNDIIKIYDRWLGRLGRPSVLLHATYWLQSIAE